ncbi:hypothetical protein EBX31_01025 [bacterium]|nr:hypothetical protein [bacterium]
MTGDRSEDSPPSHEVLPKSRETVDRSIAHKAWVLAYNEFHRQSGGNPGIQTFLPLQFSRMRRTYG